MNRTDAKITALASVRQGIFRKFCIPPQYQCHIDVKEDATGRLVVSVDVGDLKPEAAQELITYYRDHVHDKVFANTTSLRLRL